MATWRRGYLKSRKESKESRERAKQAREDAVTDLISKCRQRGARTNYSPLFANLRDTVKDLRQRCQPGDPCQILFYTDLQEIAEPWNDSECIELLGAFNTFSPAGELEFSEDVPGLIGADSWACMEANGNGFINDRDPDCSILSTGERSCPPPPRSDCSAAPMRESSAALWLLLGLAALVARRRRV